MQYCIQGILLSVSEREREREREPHIVITPSTQALDMADN